jgi:hypothetical protein
VRQRLKGMLKRVASLVIWRWMDWACLSRQMLMQPTGTCVPVLLVRLLNIGPSVLVALTQSMRRGWQTNCTHYGKSHIVCPTTVQ